jgi:hypothetical protein
VTASRQSPLGRQHAPIGGQSHGVFSHDVPGPIGIPPAAAQSSAVISAHAPEGQKQQASITGAGSMKHVPGA